MRQIIWKHKPTGHIEYNRLAMKIYLGGEVNFNKAFAAGDIESVVITIKNPNSIVFSF